MALRARFLHGIMFVELGGYMDERLGAPAGEDLLRGPAGMPEGFDSRRAFGDPVFLRLVAKASGMMGQEPAAFLEGFGEYLAGRLVLVYPELVDPRWRSLEVIENTERLIHAAVRRDVPQATPPLLACRRIGPDEVELVYASGRRLCSVAKGIIRGLGLRFLEHLEIEETACMLRRDPECRMRIRRVA